MKYMLAKDVDHDKKYDMQTSVWYKKRIICAITNMHLNRFYTRMLLDFIRELSLLQEVISSVLKGKVYKFVGGKR